MFPKKIGCSFAEKPQAGYFRKNTAICRITAGCVFVEKQQGARVEENKWLHICRKTKLSASLQKNRKQGISGKTLRFAE
jgi:hypothetical protein